MSGGGPEVAVRLLFADEGEFFTQEVTIGAEVLIRYDRLIDCLLEEPSVLKRLHIDTARLVSAERIDD